MIAVLCGLLLQALKQALEGADFREFADRVSVITLLLLECAVHADDRTHQHGLPPALLLLPACRLRQVLQLCGLLWASRGCMLHFPLLCRCSAS
jgi:hypothetical protein